MRKSLRSIAALAALNVSGAASAVPVTLDGMSADLLLVTNGQTVAFAYRADFTGATTPWLGETMDAPSIQIGAAGGGNELVSSISATANAMATGIWTGFLDKVSGNGCSANGSDAACYAVMPTATGGDGAEIADALIYEWTFDLIFKNGVDVAPVLAAITRSSS